MTNPPAFPCGGFTRVQPHEGMTLRDYFAGQVISQCAITADSRVAADSVDPMMVASYAARFAKSAYIIADAMLAERAKALTGDATEGQG